jgi:hypothetical protein
MDSMLLFVIGIVVALVGFSYFVKDMNYGVNNTN